WTAWQKDSQAKGNHPCQPFSAAPGQKPTSRPNRVKNQPPSADWELFARAHSWFSAVSRPHHDHRSNTRDYNRREELGRFPAVCRLTTIRTDTCLTQVFGGICLLAYPRAARGKTVAKH